MARKRKPNGCKNGINTSRYADCRTSADLIRTALRHPDCKGIETGGRHPHIVGPKGSEPCPDHPGDLATGTRCKIVKRLIAIGLGVLALVGLLQIDVML